MEVLRWGNEGQAPLAPAGLTDPNQAESTSDARLYWCFNQWNEIRAAWLVARSGGSGYPTRFWAEGRIGTSRVAERKSVGVEVAKRCPHFPPLVTQSALMSKPQQSRDGKWLAEQLPDACSQTLRPGDGECLVFLLMRLVLISVPSWHLKPTHQTWASSGGMKFCLRSGLSNRSLQ